MTKRLTEEMVMEALDTLGANYKLRQSLNFDSNRNLACPLGAVMCATQGIRPTNLIATEMCKWWNKQGLSTQYCEGFMGGFDTAHGYEHKTDEQLSTLFPITMHEQTNDCNQGTIDGIKIWKSLKDYKAGTNREKYKFVGELEKKEQNIFESSGEQFLDALYKSQNEVKLFNIEE